MKLSGLELARRPKEYIDGYINAVIASKYASEIDLLSAPALSDEDCDHKSGWLQACDELTEERKEHQPK